MYLMASQTAVTNGKLYFHEFYESCFRYYYNLSRIESRQLVYTMILQNFLELMNALRKRLKYLSTVKRSIVI
ncbi:hypothetical protein HS7_20930 [Sulfolobales archaeon HS-7]|nr:hypothetical protein HS7_20930 [Sulfolobales archaeon HS-7]